MAQLSLFHVSPCLQLSSLWSFSTPAPASTVHPVYGRYVD